MHPLEKKISRVIRTHNLIEPGERVVAGVSGGPDSMALLHVLAALEVNFKVVYVDHGLRPAETPVEAELVKTSARKLGFGCEIIEADVAGLAKQGKFSLEHAARIMRYDIFSRVAERFSARKIAVGHTADDQAEEILLRLIRGTARRGLSGMERMTKKGIIRPFLEIPKADLFGYLADRGIQFAEDSSNNDRRFVRNKVRLDLLPYLEDNFHQGIRSTLRRTARILTDEEEYLAGAARDLYQRVVDKSLGKQGEFCLSCEALLAEPIALQRRVIEQMLINLQTKPGGRQIENIVKFAGSSEKRGNLHLAQGLRIIKKNGTLNFIFPRGRAHFRGDA